MSEVNKFVPSKEQSNIIDRPISDRLVSAAAGSGKTTVLINRIIELIIKGDLEIDKLLVVTFTNDATNQLQNDIENELRNRIKEANKNGDIALASRLSDQLDKLPSAYIQTIDSFCTRVIKEKGYVIAGDEKSELFDTGNVILEGSQLDIILKSAISKVIGDEYLKENLDEKFVNLTKRFGDGRNDSQLANTVFSIYKKLRSLPDYIDKLDEELEKRKQSDIDKEIRGFDSFIQNLKDLFLEITPEYIDDIQNAFREAGFFYVSDSDAKDLLYEPYKNAHQLNKLSKALKDDLKSQLTDERFQIIRDIFSDIRDAINTSDEAFYNAIRSENRLPDIKYSFPLKKEEFAPVARIMPKYCAALALLCRVKFGNMTGYANTEKIAGPYAIPNVYSKLFKYSLDELLNYQIEGTAVCESLVDILKKTDKYYAEIKSVLHGMDFPDQEYAAYEILCNEDASNFYKNKFMEIYVDEYQDNTSLQDNIIKKFANGNVFRVGDIKQSIYGFRAADPKNFQNLYLEYEGTDSLSILKENYRSTAEILDFVNFIFEQEMVDSDTTIAYDENQRLNVPQNEALVKHGDIPDVLIVDKSSVKKDIDKYADEGQESEDDESGEYDSFLTPDRLALSYGVALRVSQYLKNPGTQYSDIRILTKKTKQAAAISKYLNSLGYPTTCVDETQIFGDLDIHGVLSLLIVLGNEYRSEYLYSVFLAGYSFSNFTLEDISVISGFIHDLDSNLIHSELIVKLRVFADKATDSSYEALRTRVILFLDVLDNMRLSTTNSDIDDMVERIYRETGIRATLKARGEGVTKLLLLKNWLSGNYKRYGSDFSGIADSIENMKIKIEKDASFEIRESDENTIQAMTVHRSKGLGFKYTIFALDDSAGNDDKVGGIFFDKENGFVVQNYDYNLIKNPDSIESAVLKTETLKLNKNAESMRLLYVALTRAKNKLTIVTSVDQDKDGNPSGKFAEAVNLAMLSEGKTFGKSHWINGTGEMGYQLFGALAKSREAGSLIRSTAGVETDIKEENSISFTGFKCEVVSVGDDIERNPNETIVNIIDDEVAGTEYLKSDYRYEDLITIPYKVAVTGIAHNKNKNAKHLALNLKSLDEYTAKTGGKLNASTKGTVAHLMFRYLDMDSLRNNPDNGEKLVRDLIESGVFVKYKDSDVMDVYKEFASGFVAFAKHEIGMELLEADLDFRADYEKPIVFSVPLGNTADRVLVQGVIDALYEDKDGKIVIIDYKTDNLAYLEENEYEDEMDKRHGFQINCYASALEKSGMKIRAKYIYLVRYGKFIEIK